jgi:hypothetical protein
MNRNCTVIVNSCDKYEEAWGPFFSLMRKYWRNLCFEIVLNTETKQYHREDIKITCINSPAEAKTWGARAKYVLQQIKTPYVIILLEDFFLQDYVNNDEIESCISKMDSNPNIAVFYFKKITGFDEISEEYPEYILMKENKQYKLNCQAAMWRRKVLIDLLDENESPWDFESFGQIRCVNLEQKFYCRRNGSYLTYKGDVFPYLWSIATGYGICKSKWLWNNKKLFKKHNIQYEMKTLPKLYKSKYFFQKYYEVMINIFKHKSK